MNKCLTFIIFFCLGGLAIAQTAQQALLLITPFDVNVKEHCQEEYTVSDDHIIRKELVCASTPNDWKSEDAY